MTADEERAAIVYYEVDSHGLFCKHCGRSSWLHYCVDGRLTCATHSPTTKGTAMKVSDADLAAAREWDFIECRHCSEYDGDFVIDLAQDFAARYQAGIREGIDMAAKVAEEQTEIGTGFNAYGLGGVGLTIGKAIRALIKTQTPPQE